MRNNFVVAISHRNSLDCYTLQSSIWTRSALCVIDVSISRHLGKYSIMFNYFPSIYYGSTTGLCAIPKYIHVIFFNTSHETIHLSQKESLIELHNISNFEFQENIHICLYNSHIFILDLFISLQQNSCPIISQQTTKGGSRITEAVYCTTFVIQTTYQYLYFLYTPEDTISNAYHPHVLVKQESRITFERTGLCTMTDHVYLVGHFNRFNRFMSTKYIFDGYEKFIVNSYSRRTIALIKKHSTDECQIHFHYSSNDFYIVPLRTNAADIFFNSMQVRLYNILSYVKTFVYNFIKIYIC